MRIALVGSRNDLLIETVFTTLHEDGQSVCVYEPTGLPRQKITADDRSFRINDAVINAVMLRVPPGSSLGREFSDQDVYFANAEFRALLASCAAIENLVCVNPLSAAGWFSVGGWDYYYSVFQQENARWGKIRISEESSEQWVPFSICNSTTLPRIDKPAFPVPSSEFSFLDTIFYAFGNLMDPTGKVLAHADTTLRDALDRCGVDICAIAMDTRHAPLWISPCPVITHEQLADVISRFLLDYLYSSVKSTMEA